MLNPKDSHLGTWFLAFTQPMARAADVTTTFTPCRPGRQSLDGRAWGGIRGVEGARGVREGSLEACLQQKVLRGWEKIMKTPEN